MIFIASLNNVSKMLSQQEFQELQDQMLKLRDEAVKLITHKIRGQSYLRQLHANPASSPEEVSRIGALVEEATQSVDLMKEKLKSIEEKMVEYQISLEASQYPEAVRSEVIGILYERREAFANIISQHPWHSGISEFLRANPNYKDMAKLAKRVEAEQRAISAVIDVQLAVVSEEFDKRLTELNR